MLWTFRFFLLLHILGGAAALTAGLLNIIRKKGDARHTRTGRVFLYAMVITAVSALVLAVLHPNDFLFAVAVFTLYMVISGNRYIVTHARTPFAHRPADWLITGVMALAGVWFLRWGIMHVQAADLFGTVFITFGIIGLGFVLQDVKHYTGKSLSRNFARLAHLQRMTGGFIAASTAFLVVNTSQLPKIIPGTVYWLLPTACLTPLIVYWSRKFA